MLVKLSDMTVKIQLIYGSLSIFFKANVFRDKIKFSFSK